jgi:hypothetical protein
MNGYFIFLIGFTAVGVCLLASLVVKNLLAERQSTRDLVFLAEAGKDVGENEVKIARETIRRARKTARAKVVAGRGRQGSEAQESVPEPSEDKTLEEYLCVLRLLVKAIRLDEVQQREFPVRVYMRADANTRRSLQRILILLYSYIQTSWAR